MFREERLPSPSYASVISLENHFIQKPTQIPLELPLIPTRTYVMKQETSYVPIIAIVGITITFFGLLAFLAYMRKS